MPRLGGGMLQGLPAAVRRPGYDRAKLQVGMAHLGVGAFHRCHQAEFTDDALEAAFGPWGVVGINIREPALAATLGAQDGLYSRTLRDESEASVRVIGCMREAVDAQADGSLAVNALAASRIRLVSLTVTEKGYCHRPATGEIDPAHPDIVHDLAPGARPRSVPGVLVEVLRRRRDAKAGPLTLMSCDNIPANGRILKNVVTAFAAAKSPDLGAWIGEHVRFPSAMVDRIVPASTPPDLAFASQACGAEDQAAVVGEPFRQWVVEDDFAGPRPAWEAAGAEFVADVEPYEFVKMRVLNAAQSAMSYLGALTGLDYTFEDVRDPLIARFVRQMLVAETAPHLPKGAMDIPSYINLTFKRLHNSAIRHRNHQIATDGSQKIVQRLLNPIRLAVAHNTNFDFLAMATAAWMAYLLAASPRFGARWEPSDPWADAIRRIGGEVGPDETVLVRRVMELEAIFGTDLPRHAPLVETLARHLRGLLFGSARRHLGATVNAMIG